MKWHIFFILIISSFIIFIAILINQVSMDNRKIINDIFNLELEVRDLNKEYHQLLSERDDLIEKNLNNVIQNLNLKIATNKDKLFLDE